MFWKVWVYNITIMDFFIKQPAETVFIATILIYAILVVFVTRWFSRSNNQVAHENFPKTVKHITEGFVSIVIFVLLFYLASTGILPKDVLITLVSVFATAGFLSFRNKD